MEMDASTDALPRVEAEITVDKSERLRRSPRLNPTLKSKQKIAMEYRDGTCTHQQ